MDSRRTIQKLLCDGARQTAEQMALSVYHNHRLEGRRHLDGYVGVKRMSLK